MSARLWRRIMCALCLSIRGFDIPFVTLRTEAAACSHAILDAKLNHWTWDSPFQEPCFTMNHLCEGEVEGRQTPDFDYCSERRLRMLFATLSLLTTTPTYATAILPDLSIKYVAGNALNA